MSRLALAVALLAAPRAWAGACCVGSTTTVPTRLGECEHVLAGLDVRGEASTGRWTGSGALSGSSLAEQTGTASLAAAWRWDRKGEVAVSLPLLVSRKATADAAAWGGGAGDLGIALTWDPLAEVRAPVPVLTLGARLPTGRSWDRAKGTLLEDVTGLPGAGLVAGVAVERTTGTVPWSVGLGTSLDVGAGAVSPTVSASGAVGRYFGTAWSVLGTLRHVQTFQGGGTGRTAMGVRLVRGQRLAWRAWAGAEADLPVPWAGWSRLREVSLSGGVAIVR